jgi:DNA-binding PadR family transcriptional regulator
MHIAQELEMDRTSLYRALMPMQRQGWIRLKAGADARSRTAQITRQGQKALQTAGECWEQIQVKLVREFGPRRWSAFVAEMEGLATAATLAKGGLPKQVVRRPNTLLAPTVNVRPERHRHLPARSDFSI